MKKKNLLIILVLAICFSVIGCTNDKNTIPENNIELTTVANGDYSGLAFQSPHSLTDSDGKTVYFEVENLGDVDVNIYIGNNTQDNLTLAPNEKGEIFAKVNSSNIEYKFSAVPTPNGGDIDIRYQIYQK